MFKSLFLRFLLIIITPVALLQIIGMWVFYERHWGSVSKRLEYNLIGEVKAIVGTYNNYPEYAAEVANNLYISFEKTNQSTFEQILDDRRYELEPMDNISAYNANLIENYTSSNAAILLNNDNNYFV